MPNTINRSLLIRGPAKATYNGATFYTEDDITVTITPTFTPLTISALGVVDQIKTDMVCTVDIKPFGAWENLSTLFPAALLSPSPGASLFGATDLPLVIIGRNGDQITFHSARITKMADLFLGVDAPIFSSAITFTCILKNATDPGDAAAYYTFAPSQSYGDDSAFTTSVANYKRQSNSGSWTGKTGYTDFQGDKGVNIAFNLSLTPHVNSNFGTIDYIIQGMQVVARAIPLQTGEAANSILTDMNAASGFQGSALGTRMGNANGATLTFTGASGVSITITNAFLNRIGAAWGQVPLRVGEHEWISRRTLTGGALDAVVAIS